MSNEKKIVLQTAAPFPPEIKSYACHSAYFVSLDVAVWITRNLDCL